MEPSLEYLARQLERIRTPFTLSWGVLGLAAWNQRPDEASLWLAESLGLQEQRGAYDTSHVALLVLAERRPLGLLGPGRENGNA